MLQLRCRVNRGARAVIMPLRAREEPDAMTFHSAAAERFGRRRLRPAWLRACCYRLQALHADFPAANSKNGASGSIPAGLSILQFRYEPETSVTRCCAVVELIWPKGTVYRSVGLPNFSL